MKFVRPLSAAVVALSFLMPGAAVGAAPTQPAPVTRVAYANGSFFCSVFPWWC